MRIRIHPPYAAAATCCFRCCCCYFRSCSRCCRRHPLSELMAVLREAFPSGGRPDGRCLMIEYTCLSGINDSTEDAARLVQLLKGVNAMVNLIGFNPYRGTRFVPSPLSQMRAMRHVLISGGEWPASAVP